MGRYWKSEKSRDRHEPVGLPTKPIRKEEYKAVKAKVKAPSLSPNKDKAASPRPPPSNSSAAPKPVKDNTTRSVEQVELQNRMRLGEAINDQDIEDVQFLFERYIKALEEYQVIYADKVEADHEAYLARQKKAELVARQ
uniref:Uncharacterized protein n=1 Tax=Panagrolaimus superbus TaxID=310955 RepID=A0A914YIR8_9BILA